MINLKKLNLYVNNYLDINSFTDYCPNGLQVEGRKKINKIVSGVSANLALIEKAIKEKADAIFVHHGIFWKNEPQTITAAKRAKIALLIENNINLFAYHIPLDAHSKIGNNAQLAKILAIKNPKAVKDSLIWIGNINHTVDDFSKIIDEKLQRKPLVVGNTNKIIKNIAWCSGAAQSFISQAISLEVDAYISGEISEQTPAIALENNLTFFSAGHHATERYGIMALCQHLSKEFDLIHKYIEIQNYV